MNDTTNPSPRSGDLLSDSETGNVLSLVRAGFRAIHQDEAAALLRSLSPGPMPAPDWKRLRALARVGEDAHFSALLEALAVRLPPPAAARMKEAAELVLDAAHP